MSLNGPAHAIPCDLDQAFGWIDALSDQHPYTVHQRSWWYDAYMRAFDPEALCLEVQGSPSRKLIGILPLQVQSYRGTRFWDLRLLLPLAHGPSDFVNPLVDPSHEQEFGSAVAGWLQRNHNSWDRLFLPYIPSSSRAWKPLVRALRAHGFEPWVDFSHWFYEVDTTGSWNEYFDSFFRVRNADLLKDLRRLEKENTRPRLVTVTNGIEEYLPRLMPIFDQRRKALGQFNKYVGEEPRRFLMEALRACESAGSVELSLLVGNDKDIWAYQLDWLDRGIRYHYMHAYNDRYGKHSPGKLLLFEILKRSFSSPEICRCNFMRGEARYKSNFAYHRQRFVNIELNNPRSLRMGATRMAARLAAFRDWLKQDILNA